jgi:adenosylmethionine-8-amino-7-oxononanoate aminotransferase
MEAALKMARQVHLENAQPDRKHVIARRLSYHGTTLGALAVGGLDNRKAPFAHAFDGRNCSHVSACYPYRYRLPDETSEAFVARLAAELEQEIQRIGPGNVAAFLAETVMGATVGVVPPPPGYFSAMRAVCDRYGVLMILDEVMCGMGRCGQWFAYHDEGIEPDIVCVAKGLGGGFQPIGAMLVNRRVRDALARGSGAFMHGQTYMAHATACAAACAVIDRIDGAGLIGHVRDMGDLLHRRLCDRLADHDHVGEIRGRGLFRAIELVRDRPGRTPFPAALKLHARVKAHALANGLLCYPGGGALPGGVGDHVVIAPPYIVSAPQIDDIADILATSLDAALRECRALDATSQIDT